MTEEEIDKLIIEAHQAHEKESFKKMDLVVY